MNNNLPGKIIKIQTATLDLLMRMNLRLYIICVAAIFALVVPAAADNNTATVHGEVYGWDTFEPLENAVVDVNSTPAQSMVAKYGSYSFELEPGNYSITARYYQNDTLTYSATETITIKNVGGSYVLDLLLLPVYSEELMDSSDANESSKNLTFSTGNPTTRASGNNTNSPDSVNITDYKGFFSSSVKYFLIAIMFFLMLTGSYLFFRKHKNKEKNAQQEDKTGQMTGDSSKFRNMPEQPVIAQDKSIDSGVQQGFQVNTEDTASKTEPVRVSGSGSGSQTTETDLETEPEPNISLTKPIAESESKLPAVGQVVELKYGVSEKKVPSENKEECQVQDEEECQVQDKEECQIQDKEDQVQEKEDQVQEKELAEFGSEEENENNFSEDFADISEIEISAPKKRLPLPADLQEIMDIIRGHEGRITQKDLRSRLKYSEGKVSLMLADLERRDLIEKFKRGRGNVVILKDEEL